MAHRYLTGLKPSAHSYHLGNYCGAIAPMLAAQANPDYECFIFIANYHTLNQLQDPATIQQNTHELFIQLLALGIDPHKSHLFIQSDVPELTELTWILNSITPLGLLQRAHAYKDALASGKEANMGLFDYPVLMAADILMYDSNFVPVGKDQKQHVEIARDLAEKFNHLFGETFVLPKPLIGADTMTIPGIDGQKMSKSYDNILGVFEDEATLKKKIMGIVTDSKTVEEAKDPATCLVYTILSNLLLPAEKEALAQRYRAGGLGYGEVKKMLFAKYLEFFGPVRQRYAELKNNTHLVTELRAQGAVVPRQLARAKIDLVRSRTGLL